MRYEDMYIGLPYNIALIFNSLELKFSQNGKQNKVLQKHMASFLSRLFSYESQKFTTMKYY